MPLWLAERPLLLASASEVRRKMLAAAGIPLEVKPAAIDERAVEKAAGVNGAREVASLLAREKARVVSTAQPQRLVLGADQTLAMGERRFTKPKDHAAAREQLQALSGQTHELHTAIAVLRDGAVLFEHVDVARLSMRTLSNDFIERYLESAGAAARASVGGYQLEGLGAHLFARVEGDYFTILGLPLVPLLVFLRRDGFVLS